MTPEDKEEVEKEGAPSALGKITQAGYSSLDVSGLVYQSLSGFSLPHAVL